MKKTTDTQEINSALARALEFITSLETKNREMRHCLELAQEACLSRAPVLILGESGVGKSLIAQSLHYASPNRADQCVIVDCIRTAPADVDIVIFGIAFDRDESNRQEGAIARAGKGTIILDSVDLLPISTQTELLRVLQFGKYRLVGSDKEHDAYARFVATSSANLAEKMAGGLFREDFLYAIGEVTLRIPPLRSRAEDIPTLINACILSANRRYGKNVVSISKTALDFLKRYELPGNIRELNRIINRAIIDLQRDTIYIEDLGFQVDPPANPAAFGADILSLEEVERLHIVKAVAHAKGNVRAAARILRVTEAALRRKMENYHINAENGRR
ncbi:MAG: sigma 54-interacting transcriptional regulator [Planctomycetota bacterium]|nr:sigma 54-interacting transcriptional regulator [Planctomycetota bacterium]